jgi:hypothetical protein
MSTFWEATRLRATKEFFKIYSAHTFILVFTRALHMCLSQARQLHPIYLGSILISSTLLQILILIVPFFWLSYKRILHIPLSRSLYYMQCPSLPLLRHDSNYSLQVCRRHNLFNPTVVQVFSRETCFENFRSPDDSIKDISQPYKATGNN